MDGDLFRAAIVAATLWPPSLEAEEARGVDQEAAEILGMITDACSVSMPRASPRPRRAAYWWTAEIADLRISAVRAWRVFTRQRRRRGVDAAEAEVAYGEYRGTRGALCAAISASKARAWRELLSGLDEDPWGRPYRMVLKKLRPWAPPLTESMDPRFLERVMGTLFPDIGEERPFPAPGPREAAWEWDEELGVSREELRLAVSRMGANKAPGPDGVPGRAIKMALGEREVADRMARLFTRCLRLGRFPLAWKVANVVLLPKVGKPAEDPSSYRPICLLDEAGKLLERVIVSRLVRHLSGVGPDLSDDQYGFRGGRSTIDAISHVRALSEAVTAGGGVLMAFSLDIANAFNTLPWEAVGRALVHHGVPPYLIAVVRDYFRDRRLAYRDRDQVPCGRGVSCGVPQGSVLGPLLWNLAFDSILRTDLPAGSSVVCYADDTLVLSAGNDWEEAALAAQTAVDRVVYNIAALGLRVAPHKCESLYFYSGSRRAPPRTLLRVNGVPHRVGATMKYLGLHLDGKWSFRAHFARLEPRVMGVAASLGRLLPNLGGPGGRVRRLYASAVAAAALYGAPVWASRMGGPPVSSGALCAGCKGWWP